MPKPIVAARTDNNISDDAAGAARIEAAAQSRARKAAEEASRKRDNANFNAKLKEGTSRTDSNIDDDPAGAARRQFAAESRERLAKEREERRQHKLDMEKRIRNTGPRTDNLMDTEAAAIARKELAAKSRAQKQMRDAERQRQNAELQRKIKDVKPRIDDEIDDEAAGERRAELALESQKRREEQRAQEKQWFAHLQERVEIAGRGEPSDDKDSKQYRELMEKQELHDTRGSSVSQATYIMYKNYMDKYSVAEAARKERGERDARRQADKLAWHAHGRDLSLRRAQQMDTIRGIQKQMARENQESSQQVRLEEAIWQRRRDRVSAKYMETVRERVKVARGLDVKLDDQEEEQDALERQEGSQMRSQMSEDLREVREGGLARRREQAKNLREMLRDGVRASMDEAFDDNAYSGELKREEAEEGKMLRQHFEDEYLQNARANKAAALKTRATIQASTRDLQRRRQKRAEYIRTSTKAELGIVMGESGARGAQAQKKWVRDKYAKKFVSAEEAEQWTQSPLFKVHSAAMKVRDSMFGTDNASRYNGRKV